MPSVECLRSLLAECPYQPGNWDDLGPFRKRLVVRPSLSVALPPEARRSAHHQSVRRRSRRSSLRCQQETGEEFLCQTMGRAFCT